MTISEVKARGAGLVPGAHRVIRVLDAGEGPYQGALVTRGEGVAVQADAESLTGWAGWTHAGDEHVAGPVDLVRRADGHDVLLPWCTERITVFLGRRTTADAPLSAGEVNTLVASVLRGIDELGERGDGTCTGGWWLTADGRPTFVIGAGEDAYVGAAHLVDRLQKDCGDRALGRLLSAIREGLVAAAGRPRIPRLQLERWEVELLATAAPRALRREVHGPERVRDIEITRQGQSVAQESRRRARGAALGSPSASWAEGLRGRLALLRDAAAAVALASKKRWAGRRDAGDAPRAHGGRADRDRRTALYGRGDGAGTEIGEGAPKTRSRRRFVVAGAAAAVVLGGGLLWPVGATGEPSGGATPGPEGNTGTSAPSSLPDPRRADDDAIATAAPTEAGVPSDPGDPVAAASALISVIGDCAERGDEVCAEAVVEGTVGVVDAFQSDVSAGAQPEVGLVDHYGDVAVIRVSRKPGEESGAVAKAEEQMLVLVRTDEKWLVRDVYGVADQPE